MNIGNILYVCMVLDPKILKRLPEKNIEEAQSVLANLKIYLKERISDARQLSRGALITRKKE